MGIGWKSGLAWALMAGTSATAWGQQVTERDTTLVGPRGRAIERDIRVERGPGYVDRRVEVKRPGETIIRDTRVATPGGGRPNYYGGYGGGPRYVPGRPIVENFIVQRPAPFATFVGLPGFSLFLGGPPPPPPPVVIYPPPIYGPPPVVVGPPPPPAVVDPIAEPLGQLKSLHSNHRRDACLVLGNLRDPRAVGALIDRLDHDFEKEVRTSAAWALGEIGDPRAAVPLERATLVDKRNDVREAAKAAYARLPRPGQQVIAAPSQAIGHLPSQVRGTVTSTPAEPIDPGPPSNGRRVDDEPPLSNGRRVDDQPPPPPVPVNSPTPPPIPPGLDLPR